MEKESFIFPHSRYHGHFTPENLLFNANLQQFAQQIGYIANLETGGKLTPEESFQKIEQLWQLFQGSSRQLGIGTNPSS